MIIVHKTHMKTIFRVLIFLVTNSHQQIKFPSIYLSPTSELTVAGEINSRTLSIFISKSRPGHLCLGFGTSMQIGDVFLIQFTPYPTIQDCTLNGYATPLCVSGSKWKLAAIEVSDSGWSAEIQRRISSLQNFAEGVNLIIFSYTDSPLMAFHTGSYSNKMVIPLYIVTKKVTTTSTPTSNVTNATQNSTTGSSSSNPSTASNTNGTDKNSSGGSSNQSNNSGSANDTSGTVVSDWTSQSYQPVEVDSSYGNDSCVNGSCPDVIYVLPSKFLPKNYTMKQYLMPSIAFIFALMI